MIVGSCWKMCIDLGFKYYGVEVCIGWIDKWWRESWDLVMFYIIYWKLGNNVVLVL